MNVLGQYLKAGRYSLLAKIIVLISVFAEIYFLNALLGKSGYGDFVFVLTIIITTATVFANPFRSYILYKSTDENTADITRMMLMISVIIGVILTVCFYVGAQYTHNFWYVLLAWIIPAEIARNTLSTYYQSRQNIAAMVMFNTVMPHMLRIFGLIVLWVFNMDNPVNIAGVYWIVFFIPVAVLILQNGFFPSWHFADISRQDIRYMAHLIGTQIVHQSTRIIDLLFVGVLLTATITAEYAVAMKCAAVLYIGKQLTEHLLTPRLKNNDGQSFKNEYAIARDFSIITVMAGVIFFAIFGTYILPLFGDYGVVTLNLFLVLSVAAYLRVVTGCSSEFLAMNGHTGWILNINIATVIIASAFAILTIPSMGVTGAGWAAMTGAFISCIFMIYACWRTEKFICVSRDQIYIMPIFIAFCMAGAQNIIPHYICGIGCFIILMWFAFLRRHIRF